MRILVTGGAGFIGSHIVDALIEEGHEVSVVDSLWEHGGGKEENVNPQASFYRTDIGHDLYMDEVFYRTRPEVVYHLAAQSSLSISTRMPKYDAMVNVVGMLSLLELCINHDVRKVVFASSSAIYGTVEQMPLYEDTPKNPPETPYGITKLVGEHYLHFWKKMHGLDYTILRYGNVYGPRQDPNGENGVVAIFANHILRGEPVRIDGDGNQSKDYVYVGDVARANVLALDKGSGETYCIGTGYPRSVNDLYRQLCEIIGHEAKVEHAPKRPGDVRRFAYDYSKAERDLGWRPTVWLIEGLERTVEYYRSQLETVHA